VEACARCSQLTPSCICHHAAEGEGILLQSHLGGAGDAAFVAAAVAVDEVLALLLRVRRQVLVVDRHARVDDAHLQVRDIMSE